MIYVYVYFTLLDDVMNDDCDYKLDYKMCITSDESETDIIQVNEWPVSLYTLWIHITL